MTNKIKNKSEFPPISGLKILQILEIFTEQKMFKITKDRKHFNSL